MEALFTNLCPNCGGEIDDVRLEKKLPCKKCLPEEVTGTFKDIVLEVGRRLKRTGAYDKIYNVVKELEAFEQFFKVRTGYKLWSAQRTWAKRLLLGRSFSIVAPTGVGKSLFGLMWSLFIAKKGKKSYIILPTSTLVQQTLERANDQSVIGFHSGMTKKQKEEFEKRLQDNDFAVLVTTSQFLARKFDLLNGKKFDFIFIDDVDAFLRASKNIDRVLKLLGFDDEDIEAAMELILERMRIARGRGDPEKIREIEERLKGLDKKGQVVVASATGRAKGIRVRLFRELLNFEVGSTRANLRNVVNVYSKKDVVEIVRFLGKGGIVFVVPQAGEVDEVVERLKEAGIKVALATGEHAVKALETFKEGEVDVLVGSAVYYGTLVRGIDLPEKVRYVVFVGVPRFKFNLDLEGITPTRLAFLLDIIHDVTGREELRRLANLLRRYGREEDVEQGKMIVKELLSNSEVVDKLRNHPDIILEEDDGLKIIIPDYKTYIQGSGRCSRMYAGGVTKGISVVIVDHQRAFEMLRRIVFNLYNEEFVEWENVNWEKLIEEVDEDRKKVSRSKKWEDPVKSVLFIVESPNKARTIARFFGRPSIMRMGRIRSYEVALGKYILNVVATGGHMFDLVVDRGFHGVEVNDKIVPVYTTIKICRKCGAQTTMNVCPKCGNADLEDALERVEAIRELALQSDVVLVGTDPDTEGEKIAWDVYLAISPYVENIYRVEFHEVTKNAILRALEDTREINKNRVRAQMVRRIEDRWIGFELSQKLWVVFNNRTLSAGRVQTPVLGWIIDRYTDHKKSVAVFVGARWKDGYAVFETPFKNTKGAEEYVKNGKIRVTLLSREEKIVNPLPPFTTDTMIREAGTRLRLGAKEIMDLAQDLFEAGLITYHRTDATHVSSTGIAIAREYITSRFGEEYFQGRSWGPEGTHECIRPTRPLDVETLIRYIRDGEIAVEGLTRNHFRLYGVIFERFMESQMASARVVEGKYKISLEGLSTEETRLIEVKNPGWMTLRGIKEDPLKEGTFEVEEIRVFKAAKIPLYTQSDVVGLMKERGIGRPSTYATIVQKLLDRRYVLESREKRKLYPTPLGRRVYNYLNERFPELVSEERTRVLEEIMDSVEEGKADYQKVLKDLYREIMMTKGVI